MTQATWLYKSAGSVASASGTYTSPLSVGLPSGITAGDILLLWATQGGAGRTYTPSDAGFTSLKLENGDTSTQAWAKIASGSESSLTVQSSSDVWTVYSQCARFYGGTITSIAAMTDQAIAQQNNGSTNQNWPALTPGQNNCLVVAITGGYWSTSASGNLDLPSPWAASIGLAHDTQFVCGAEYVIQTTASAISGGHWSPSVSGTVGYATLNISLIPGTVPVGGTNTTYGFFTEAAAIAPLAWIIRRRMQRARGK
ncbi:MAG: hypothetical protein KGL39_45895 [Patescibacteria group bacterium]|nr:hypothetical protein [Patescibacteria group bacterium]